MILIFKRIFIATLFACLTTGVYAQVLLPTGGEETTEIALPDPLTSEAAREMVSRLSDEQVRAILLDRLDAVAKANAELVQSDSDTLLEFTGEASMGALRSLLVAVKNLPLLWSSQKESFVNFHNHLGWHGIAMLFGSMFLALAIGFAAELVVNKITRRWHANVLNSDKPETLRETVKLLFFRLMNELYGLFAFFIVARTINHFIIPEELLPFSKIILFNMVVVPRVAAALVRFLLAPRKPEFRLVHADNQTAQYLYRNLIGIFLLMGLTFAFVEFNRLNGIPMEVSQIGFWLNSFVHIYIIWIVWKAWDGLVMMQRGDEDVNPYEARVAKAYPIYAIAVSIVMWMVVNILINFGQLEILLSKPHYKTMALLLCAPILDTLVRALVRHLVPPMTGEGMIAEYAYASAKRSYIRIGRILVFALMMLLISRVWGVSLGHLASTAGVGLHVASNLIEVMIILATGYLIWELISLWINRKLAAEQTALGFDLTDDEPGGGEGGAAGGSRLSTVLPLILSIAKVTIITIFGLLALANIGVNITPLLAGAGILGLAVGFGAQKLVSDIVSGIFFLIDDAFRTGEYVSVEGTVGTVEKISIRSMQLRHHKGPVHTIPYGAIPNITNYSRDWVIMKLKFTVPFESDPMKIKKIFKKIGNDMMQVPEYAEDFLQPFKSQGVFDFDDVGMIIRGKFMAKPGRQWTLRKEIFNRVKAAFEEAGIDFARREVRVAIPNLDQSEELSEQDKATITAAAAEAAQQVEVPADPKKKK